MAKLSSINKNKKRRNMVKKFHVKRTQLKSRIYDKNVSLEDRFALVTELAKLPRDSSSTRVRNRCALTGRPRGYIRCCGVSRNVFRDLAGNGMLPGVIKASW